MTMRTPTLVGRVVDQTLELAFADDLVEAGKGQYAYLVGTIEGPKAVPGLASLPTYQALAAYLLNVLGDEDRPDSLTVTIGGAPLGTHDLRLTSGARIRYDHVANDILKRVGAPGSVDMLPGGAVDKRDQHVHDRHNDNHVSVADALRHDKKLSAAVSRVQDEIRAQRALERAEAERKQREKDAESRKAHQRDILIRAGFSSEEAAAAVTRGLLDAR